MEILIYSGLTVFFCGFWVWLFHDRETLYSDEADN